MLMSVFGSISTVVFAEGNNIDDFEKAGNQLDNLRRGSCIIQKKF